MDDLMAYLQAWNSGELLPGLSTLRHNNPGASQIKVALLDSQVNPKQPLLAHHQLPQVTTPASHGTHIATVIAGYSEHPEHPYRGLAPATQLLSIPVYDTDDQGQPIGCDQARLADAIEQACDRQAHIINISGGELTRFGFSQGVLANAVQRAHSENRLIIAAAGNDGVDGVHTPACLPGVLAVGAADWDGRPLPFSNHGEHYQQQGLLAPGLNIPGGGEEQTIMVKTGTSFATGVVSGIVALFLSRMLAHGVALNPLWLRKLLLDTATPALKVEKLQSKQVLAGRINLEQLIHAFDAAISSSHLTNHCKDNIMSDPQSSPTVTQGAPQVAPSHSAAAMAATPVAAQAPITQTMVTPSAPQQVLPQQQQVTYAPVEQPAQAMVVQPNSATSPRASEQLVYCLGSIGFDWQIEARQDYFLQQLSHIDKGNLDERMFRYIVEGDEWDNAELLTWVLKIDGTPTYAVKPIGAGKRDLYKLLISCLYYQLPLNQRPDIKQDFVTAVQQQIIDRNPELDGLTKEQALDKLKSLSPYDQHIFLEEEVALYKMDLLSNLHVDWAAVGGAVCGEVQLYNGSKVPLIEVSFSGLKPWDKNRVLNTMTCVAKQQGGDLEKYINNQLSQTQGEQAKPDDKFWQQHLREPIERALDKIYYELKNNGISEEERAINYVGTNIFELAQIFSTVFEVQQVNGKLSTRYEFDSYSTEKSKVQRPTSILIDVVLRFFEPNDKDKALKCYRFTVDVSDVNPVTVEGKPKEYYESNFRHN